MTMSASSPVDIKDSQLQMQVQEAQSRSRSLKMPQGPGSQRPVDKEAKLRGACEGFESIFIQKMWEQMRATVPKTGFLHGREEQFWQGMFDQELAKKMASAGGIGLADMMYDQLSRTLVSSSRTTASALTSKAQGSGFEVSAAPLMPNPVQATAQNAATDNTKEHAMYAGAAAQPEARPPAENTGADADDSKAVEQVLAQLRARQKADAPAQQTIVNTTQMSGSGRAQAARQTANSRMPANGVLPPLAQTQAPQATAPLASNLQTPVDTQADMQAPLPPQFIMQPDQGQPATAPPDAAQSATAPNSVAFGQDQQGLMNSSFTTNVPPKRSATQKRPARMASGQPLIRTLGGAPASPIPSTQVPQQTPMPQPMTPPLTPSMTPSAATTDERGSAS